MKAKRLLMALFAIVFTASTALAEIKSGSCGDNATYALDTETGLLKIEGTGAMKNYSYSSYVPWYSNRGSIIKVEIADGITSIGNSAFDGCSSLTSVTIPESVTSIGYSAFYGCSSLTSVAIPESVTSIINYAFYGCSSLTSVTIPNSVTFIGVYAFRSCSGLTSVTIPNSVTRIGDNAFSGCSGLISPIMTDRYFIKLPENYKGEYTIPEGLDMIGGAFYDCSGLTSVTIPNSVTSIGESAFCYCSSLTSVTIPNSVTSIGESAFNGCSGLTSVTIGNSVTSIGNWAFEGCSGLTSVTIPNSVTSIGSYAFQYCSGLTSVTIGNSVTSIGYAAFEYCKVNTLTWNAKNCTGSMSDISSYLTDLIIGDSVTTIYDTNFKSCTNIKNITIGKNVADIRAQSFYNCKNLQIVTSYAKEPPYMYPNVFQNKPSTAVLKVYASCADKYRKADQWKDFIIETMADPRDGVLEELESLYTEYSGYTFKTGTEGGQYGKDEVKAFYAARNKAGEIITFPEDYSDEEIQAALEGLKATYQAVLASKVEGLTIADSIALNITEKKTYTNLTYTRTFASTDWEPLCVPIAMQYEDWADQLEVADIYDINQHDTDEDGVMDVTELEVATMKSGATEPNGLYLVRAKQPGECSINVSNGTVYPTAVNSINCSSTKMTYTFTGVYSELEKENAYTIQNGELVLSHTATIQPQRWYMTIQSRGTAKVDSPAKIRIRTTEDYVDGIESLTPDFSAQSGEIYDLQGRRIQKPAKGLYIQNGKKMLMK